MRNSEAGVCQNACGGGAAGSLLAIGSRTALALRLRVPFWLIPGDLIVATPILALTSMKTLTRMGIVSINGGLIPWQAAIPSKVGRFQFILGREVGLNLYGYTRGADKVTVIPVTPTGYGTPIQYEMKSMEWEFPLVEWRLFRTFAGKQASAFVVQFGGGYEHVTSFKAAAGAPPANPASRYVVFLRASFDGRQYF
jgi:hypothetical protein